MIRFTIGKTRVSIHALMPLFLALFAVFAGSNESLALCASLCLHEAAHLLCARALGVRVEQLSLMPFGGAARLGNPYLLLSGKLIAISAAGPAANLALLFTGAALAQWRVLPPNMAAVLARVNLALLVFNLLPALPLDGGRVLVALAERPLGRTRAVKLGVWMGRFVSLLLVLLAVHGFVRSRRLNLTTLLAAVFILSSANDDLQARDLATAASIAGKTDAKSGPLPMRLYAVDAGAPLLEALRRVRSDRAAGFIVYRAGLPIGFVDECEAVTAMLADSTAAFSDAQTLALKATDRFGTQKRQSA